MKTIALLLLALILYSCSSSTAPSNSTQPTLPGYHGFPYLGMWQDGWLNELDTLRFTSASSVQWSYSGQDSYTRNLPVTLASDSICAIVGATDSTCIVLHDTLNYIWIFRATDSSLQQAVTWGWRDAFKR